MYCCLAAMIWIVLLQFDILQAQDIPHINKRLYVSFYYDATGNRISRQIIIAMKTSGNEDSMKDVRLSINNSCMDKFDILPRENETSSNEGDILYEDRIGDIAFFLYPNPVHESFNVLAQNQESYIQQEQIRFGLYTLSGYLLQQGTIALEENKVIAMGKYPAGIYLFQIENNGCSETWKIIKQ